MAIKWPESLVTEIAERRCIIFMGAGASAGSLAADGIRRPPTWLALLENAMQYMKNEAEKRFARKLLKKQRLLDAAEVIRSNCNAADFALYLENVLSAPQFAPSAYYRAIRDIDAKLVITTNYDQIYDRYVVSGAAAEGYRISRYHDPVIVENLRSRQRLVLKAHGCLTQPNDLILTRTSYYRARRDYAGFYNVLDALFLTQTILFVGCSLTDPDIQLTLENANISVPSAHPHYALTETAENPIMKSAIKAMHNIELIEFSRGAFTEAENAMNDLRDRVIAKRSLPA